MLDPELVLVLVLVSRVVEVVLRDSEGVVDEVDEGVLEVGDEGVPVQLQRHDQRSCFLATSQNQTRLISSPCHYHRVHEVRRCAL